MHGKIKWYDQGKGYGFVTGQDGQDAFLHHSNLMVDGVIPAEGQRCEFEAETGPKGLRVAGKLRLLAVLLMVGLLALLPAAGGCVNPPPGTVYVHDQAGGVTGLAYDRDRDGQADLTPQTRAKLDPVTSQPVSDPTTGKPVYELVLDAAGKPVMIPALVPGSGGYKTAETVDQVAPGILTAAGGLVPGAIGAVLIGLGAAWKVSRFGRVIGNTVISIQTARQRLKDGGYEEALKLVDEALKSGQLQATADEIAKIKRAMGLASVSDSRPANPQSAIRNPQS
jgi:CspA family cold shock protein